MHIVTGGAGFIGSALVQRLNRAGVEDILIVDNLGHGGKWRNLASLRFSDYLHKDEFLHAVDSGGFSFKKVEAVVHLGACSSTTETDAEYLMNNNYRYTRILAQKALESKTRFIYASSAATYSDGSWGFADDDATTLMLRPINMYGYSKHLFDLWVVSSGLTGKVAGIKFFNVFGPNEYHKGDMRSVVHKAYGQIKETGEVKLFKSYRPEYADGGQVRDFVYIKDCVEILWWLIQKKSICGVFNLGTGKARSWNDLVSATFAALGMKPKIQYIEMPEEIRGQYQYHTQAKMEKMTSALKSGISFHSLEEAITDYVQNYLERKEKHL